MTDQTSMPLQATPKSDGGALPAIAVGLVMLLIGVGAGWALHPIIFGDDDDTSEAVVTQSTTVQAEEFATSETVPPPVTTVAATTTVAPATTVVPVTTVAPATTVAPTTVAPVTTAAPPAPPAASPPVLGTPTVVRDPESDSICSAGFVAYQATVAYTDVDGDATGAILSEFAGQAVEAVTATNENRSGDGAAGSFAPRYCGQPGTVATYYLEDAAGNRSVPAVVTTP